MNCEEQETCNLFEWKTHKKRTHHIRKFEKCNFWEGNKCNYKPVACELEKVKRLKGEQ